MKHGEALEAITISLNISPDKGDGLYSSDAFDEPLENSRFFAIC